MFKGCEKKGKDPESSTKEKPLEMTNRAQFLFPMTDLYGSDLQCFAYPPCAFKQKFSRTSQGVCSIVPFESLPDTVTENDSATYTYLYSAMKLVLKCSFTLYFINPRM